MDQSCLGSKGLAEIWRILWVEYAPNPFCRAPDPDNNCDDFDLTEKCDFSLDLVCWLRCWFRSWLLRCCRFPFRFKSQLQVSNNSQVTNSLTHVAGVRPIPAYWRLTRKKITLAGHLVLGLGAGGLVGQVRGLVNRKINCKQLIWSWKTSGTQCARKGHFLLMLKLP